MQAQTISDLKSAAPDSSPESLWHFLAGLPTTMEAQILYALLLGGLVGLAGHYVIKWTRGEIEGSLWNYMFIDNPRRSWLSITLVVGELLGEVSSGLFTTGTGQFVGWGIVLLSGLKSGYTIDSVANKSDRPEWSPEERAYKAAVEAEKTSGDTK